MAAKEVEYKGEGRFTFDLTEKEKEFMETVLNYQNYQIPQIEVMRVYVTSEDRFYAKLVKTNVHKHTDTIFLPREEVIDNKNYLLIAERFGAYGVGMDEHRLRLACNLIRNTYEDCPVEVVDNFGEIHYTYGKIGKELKKITEDLKNKNAETSEVQLYNGLLLISMEEMKKYVKKWGKAFREFKDYMVMLDVVEVSAGEKRNCRYKHKSDSPWYMAFRIDRLENIK